jgi:hypothetical protein
VKATVAANRAYPSLDELTERAVAWLGAMTPIDRLVRYEFTSSQVRLAT